MQRRRSAEVVEKRRRVMKGDERRVGRGVIRKIGNIGRE